MQLIINEKGPYVDSDCVYKDVSVEVAQDATSDEVEEAISNAISLRAEFTEA